jgi:hypothetical protein
MSASWKRTTLALALLTAICGCGGERTSEPDHAELNRLRSLPYVGSTPILPGDEEDGVVLHDEARSYPGYTLYTVQNLAMAVLIDQSGKPVNAWHHPASARWERTELLPLGDLMIIGANKPKERIKGIPDETRYLARLNWDGRVVWRRYMTAHHDVELNPNGELAVMAFVRRQIPAIDPTTDIRDDLLVLLDNDGNPLGSRSLLQAFKGRADIHPLDTPESTTLGVRPWIDIFHSNSIEWMHQSHLEGRHEIYAPGNVLICSRNQNCIAVVNWETGKVIWAWGADELSGPHDAQVLENGNILLFDNGLGRDWSRVIELDPVSETIVWEYKAPVPQDFYSRTKGSCQRLPNGNTLIANSDNGKAFEVTQDGEIVWKYVSPHRTGPNQRGAIVRAVRYEEEFVEALMEGAVGE